MNYHRGHVWAADIEACHELLRQPGRPKGRGKKAE
jgi:hypothetical protein